LDEFSMTMMMMLPQLLVATSQQYEAHSPDAPSADIPVSPAFPLASI
jgi:hypothetical protein